MRSHWTLLTAASATSSTTSSRLSSSLLRLATPPTTGTSRALMSGQPSSLATARSSALMKVTENLPRTRSRWRLYSLQQEVRCRCQVQQEAAGAHLIIIWSCTGLLTLSWKVVLSVTSPPSSCSTE